MMAEVRSWVPKTPRGTILIASDQDRGATVYDRLGERLAFDGYTVVTSDVAVLSTRQLSELWTDASSVTDRAQPLIVLGIGAGAVAAVRAVNDDAVPAAALVLAGASFDPPRLTRDDFDGDLALRSACPVHRVVRESLRDRSASVAAAVDASVFALALAPVSKPALLIHGGADAISPSETVFERVRDWADVRLVEVVGGLHDTVNDVAHRSVAAAIVLFAEAVRAGAVPLLVERTAEFTTIERSVRVDA